MRSLVRNKLDSMKLENSKIGIIGLGYVGLPLAVAFAEKYPVIGFDINENRVNELLEGVDNTLEIESNQLQLVLKTTLTNVNGFFPTTNSADLANCSAPSRPMANAFSWAFWASPALLAMNSFTALPPICVA